jgi:small-conductance mechanosensitive channel
MKKASIRALLVAIVCLLPGSFSPHATAQQSTAQPTPTQSSAAQDTPEEEIAPHGQVEIEGRPVLIVYESVAALTPEQRARAIEGRILSFARDASLSPESIRLEPRDAWTEILADNTIIMAVTDADARPSGKTRQQLSIEYADSIRRSVQTYREEHSWRMFFRAILKTSLTTVVLLALLWLLHRLRLLVRSQVEWRVKRSERSAKESPWHAAVAYLGPVLLVLGALLRWVFILALLETYLTVTLGFYSTTREISLTATRWILAQLETLGRSAVDYLPNLLVIAVIAIVTRYVVGLIRLIFAQIGKGDVKIRGFYPDWAEPTEKLIRVMILILALIVGFPYLPGARSPAFQGISIFVGVLLSLGSSSAVANAIAGVILTYMRSFLLGDWVQIGDTMGEVIEKNMLVTRLLTPKAEIITIPNSTVMSGAVKNYSTEAKKAGVIFYTSLSIGYDVPWTTVHELLFRAALATGHVLREPAPFVLQRALNDFYVTYELNAYTDAPREVLNIYSDLHRNIQDTFNEAGVEICSPHFSALRDGNTIAIPENYIKPDYKAPGLRIDMTEMGANKNIPQSTQAVKPASN